MSVSKPATQPVSKPVPTPLSKDQLKQVSGGTHNPRPRPPIMGS